MDPSTHSAGLLDRLGLTGARANDRFVMKLVLAILGAYALSFAVFYPSGISNWDETTYIQQARLVFEGRTSFTVIEALTGESSQMFVSTRVPGPAVLMAPFVRLAGWRGAFVVPCVSLLAAVLLMTRWLRNEGRSPFFALILMGSPAALVQGRMAMGDTLSTAIVTLGLLFFFRGIDRRAGWWLASGFVAGLSWSFRASNPLLFVPLFAGALLRRDRNVWALVVSGVVGMSFRLLAMRLYFGDAFQERAGYVFAPETLMERLPLYLLGMLVFVPGGLVFASLYRGRRRIEVIATIWIFFGAYLLQTYSSIESGFFRRIILALRYLMPLIPIMLFAMAEAVPRLFATAEVRWSERARQRLRAVTAVLVGGWIVGAAGAATAVHPFFAAWTASRDAVRQAIDDYVPKDAVLVANRIATQKYLNTFERKFKPLDTHILADGDFAKLLERHDRFYIVILDRNDSPFWLESRAANAAFIESLEPLPEPLFERTITPTDHLRIWRVDGPNPRRSGVRS